MEVQEGGDYEDLLNLLEKVKKRQKICKKNIT